MQRHLLLLSNSSNHGGHYLEHCNDAVKKFFGRFNVATLLFVPYALKDRDAYANKVKKAFHKFDIEVESIHESENPVESVQKAQAIFIGGGNTFLLLKTILDLGLVEPIRKRVLQDGIPYMGSSAGTNVSTVSICTTNDMPIVYPLTFSALNLVPFNINPHYVDADPLSRHMGVNVDFIYQETREERINQYHEISDMPPVVGLREGSWLEIDGDSAALCGDAKARIFVSGKSPQEYEIGSSLGFLFHL